MRLITLSKDQVRWIYEYSTIPDFPDDERKPLSMILDSIDRGVYDCLGIEDGGQLKGYAYFVHHDTDYLLDYFAVFQEYRNAGIGSVFLTLLKEHYQTASALMIEVEDPTLATPGPEQELMQRRLDFYLRNGCRNTGVTVNAFDVDYAILELPTERIHTEDEMRASYIALYRFMLPPHLYHRVHVHDVPRMVSDTKMTSNEA